MDYSTKQQLVPKMEENPLESDYLYQDPFHNATSMFEAPQPGNFQDDHEFNSLALPLKKYNQTSNIGFQELEDFGVWDFTALDLTSTSNLDYNVLDEKPPTTTLESFGDSSNGLSDLGHLQASMVIESSGFSSTQCDSVVFDEKPISTMVGSSDCLKNKPTDLGHHEVLGMMRSSASSSTHCDSAVFDGASLSALVESFTYLDSVPSNLGQHEVPMMFDEMLISAMVESCDNSNNVLGDFCQHEAFMRIESPTALSSSHSTSLVLYENSLSTIVDAFDYSDVPTHDEVSVMTESGYPSWDITDISLERETSIRRRCNTQVKKIKSDGLEFEEIKKYFDLPLTEAAKELKVGVTLLKRRCRELNILRWPHRKIRSLNSLIETLKAMDLKNEVKMLEENKRLLQQVPNMDLTKRTKKLRQSVFKANHIYKKKMSLPLLLG